MELWKHEWAPDYREFTFNHADFHATIIFGQPTLFQLHVYSTFHHIDHIVTVCIFCLCRGLCTKVELWMWEIMLIKCFYLVSFTDLQQLSVCPKGSRGGPTALLARQHTEKETVPTMLIKDLFHLLTEALSSTMVSSVQIFHIE